MNELAHLIQLTHSTAVDDARADIEVYPENRDEAAESVNQITEQICSLHFALLRGGELPEESKVRFNRITVIGKRYARNAFAYVMDANNIHVDIDNLQIPANIYAKQV